MKQLLCKGVLIIQLITNTKTKKAKLQNKNQFLQTDPMCISDLRFLNLKQNPYNLGSTRSAFKASFQKQWLKKSLKINFSSLNPDKPHQMWSHRFWEEGGRKKPPLPLTLSLQLYQSSPGRGRALLLHGPTPVCCARAQACPGICSRAAPAADCSQIGQGLTSPVGNAKALHRISWGWHKTLRAHGCFTECWL